MPLFATHFAGSGAGDAPAGEGGSGDRTWTVTVEVEVEVCVQLVVRRVVGSWRRTRACDRYTAARMVIGDGFRKAL